MLQERPRVALVASSFHPHVGGVEAHVRSVATALRALGHDVTVWTVDRGEALGVRTVDGITVRYLPTPLPAATPGAVLRFARSGRAAYREWVAAFREDRPQLLHIHCFGPNGLYAAALARRTHTPLVVTSHGETTGDDHDVFAHSWQLRRGLRRALRQATGVTGVSASVLHDLRHRFGLVGGTVVPNGVDADVVAEECWPTPPGPPARTLLAVGRIERVKGFDLLIQALPKVREAAGDVEVRIGGTGSQETPLRTLVERLDLAGAVTFLGPLTPGQVAAQMTAADVVVVPSRTEAFGIVVLEAWRRGTPVVASDRAGLGELVRDGVDGLLVDPEDIAALAGAIVRVLGDAALAEALAGAGCTRVGSFTWEAVARDYADVYAAALSSVGRLT